MKEHTARRPMSRTQVTHIVRREGGARYWPFALIVYPLLLVSTAGIGLWIMWAWQEKRAGANLGVAVLRALGFIALITLPLGYLFVASTYGQNLHYVTQPGADPFRTGTGHFAEPIEPQAELRCAQELLPFPGITERS